MTRGRHANHVYVAVDDVDPTCDYLPDPHATPAGRDVLERILATSGAELSATQTITARQNDAGSLKRLQPIRQTLLADAVAHRWTATLRDVGLTPEQVDTVVASPACGPLFVALERGTTLGHPMDHLLRGLINASPLGEHADPAGDIAAVLHSRVQAWLHTQVDNPQTITTTPRPEDLQPEAAETLRQVDELIAARMHALTDHAITTAPAWLTTLGPRPDDDAVAWLQQVAAIAAHRDYADGPTLIRAAEPPRPPLAPPVAAPDAHDWSRS